MNIEDQQIWEGLHRRISSIGAMVNVVLYRPELLPPPMTRAQAGGELVAEINDTVRRLRELRDALTAELARTGDPVPSLTETLQAAIGEQEKPRRWGR